MSSRPPLLDLDQACALLGGLTPQAFMRDYWQKKPLLVRQAIPGFQSSVTLEDIRTLARRPEVESRLITRGTHGWSMKRGPLRGIPPKSQPNWTILVQSVDLHDDETAALMRQFRFIGDARLDDLMISIASDGGGVGPHDDSYDVFLLQGMGRRRWRTSCQQDRELVPDLPLKILADFRPDTDDILEPGDLLYLPPHVCHDGVAVGNDCMTLSIGFRAPSQATLARGILEAAADQLAARHWGDPGLYGQPSLPGPDLSALYTDPQAIATTQPAQLPPAMIQAALDALQRCVIDEAVAARFLGQWLSALPDNALFDPPNDPPATETWMAAGGQLALDRCTRMMYSQSQLFINGEVADIAMSPALQQLADQRTLPVAELPSLDAPTRALIQEWLQEGWVHWVA